VTRLAKATSAIIFGRSASGAAGRDARSFATRGASRGGNGSGAPSLAGPARARLALFAVAALSAFLLLLAPVAQAAPKGVTSFFGNPGGASTPPVGVAVNTTGAGPADAGDIYFVEQASHRILRFDSLGQFVSMWGNDVVSPSGTGNQVVPVNERQTVTLAISPPFGTITGGNFTLGFDPDGTGSAPVQNTDPIPYNAPAAGNTTAGIDSVQEALEGLAGIAPGDVAVTSTNPGGGSAAGGPYTVDFGGGLAATDIAPLVGNPSGLTVSDIFPPVVNVSTTTQGGFAPTFEVCTVAEECKAGAEGSRGGEFRNPVGVAVDQQTGNVYVVERHNNVPAPAGGGARVQAFSGDGQFLWAIGKDAIVASPSVDTDLGNVFEVCTHSPDCKAPVVGTKGGEFGAGGVNTSSGGGNGVAVVPTDAGGPAPNAGNVLVTDLSNRRVQEFEPDGSFVRAFGADVVPPGSAGNVATGERQTLTVGAAAGTFRLTFNGQTTVALPFDAPAADPGTPGVLDSVAEALNDLTSIKPAGSVSVAGGPGDTTGSSPYEIVFGGSLGDADIAQITADSSALLAGPGRELTCAGGPASGVTLGYQWLANGQSLGAANGAQTSTYEVQPGDAGKAIQCRVTAVNSPSANTGATTVSTPATIAATPTGPLPTPPSSIAIGGNATATSTLTCPAGSWGNSPTSYTYAWLRNGTQVLETETKAATSDTYAIQAADLASAANFQCVVSAANANGAVAKASNNKATPSSPNPPGAPSPGAPTATSTVAPLAITATAVQGASAFEICAVGADCKAGVAGTGAGQFATNTPNRVAADSDGDVYTVENAANFRLQRLTAAGSDLVPEIVNPDVDAGGPALPLSGASSSNTPLDVAVGPDDGLFLVKAYAAGAGVPAALVSERRVVELDDDGAYVETHGSRAGIPSVAHLALNTDSEEIYLSNFGGAGVPGGIFALGESGVPTVSMGVGAVGPHTAQLNGLVNPGGPATQQGIRTKYHFEFRKVGAPGWTALSADKDAGNGFATVVVHEALGDLEAGTAYEARLIASKPFSGVASIETAPETFSTPVSQPDIDAAYATERGATTARLNARINPNGQATTYRFQYGTSAAYGITVPIPDASAGSGTASQIFSEAISGLAPETTYHFRVLATSAAGTAKSPDRTFTTTGDVPQPEGRAYELVSPPDKLGGSGVGPWYAGVGSGATGIPALEGDRYASQSYYGASLTDGGFSYGSDWTLGERTPAGWVNRPFFNRPGGFGTAEFTKVVGLGSVSDDLSLLSTASATQISIFEEQAAAWPGGSAGSAAAPALREWDSGRWEIAAPFSPDQVAGGLYGTDRAIQVAPGGGYAAINGGIRGVAGPGDPTDAAFSGDPSDFIPLSTNGNVYLDDVSAGLSDSFPGAGIRSLVNVCTGTGADRTEVPSVDGNGRIAAVQCGPVLPGRDARLIDPRGGALTSGQRGAVSRDAARVLFMSPGLENSDNLMPCTGTGAATRCPTQLYARQRGANGAVTVRWISRSAVPGQDASLISAAIFERATPDGDKVFFRTASPLTADDPNGGAQVPGGVRSGAPNPDSVDLYMYDFPDAPGADPGDGTLTRLSAGPTGGADANVFTGSDIADGDVTAVRAFGADGTRVYFATAAPLPGVPGPANGTITMPGGTVSQGATRNLYLYDAARPLDERWRFVARLPVDQLGSCAALGSRPGGGGLDSVATIVGHVQFIDGHNCVRANDDGSFITLFTDARLTVDDPDAVTGDVYGYDAVTDELVRVSAPQGGTGAAYVCVTSGMLCHGDQVISSVSTEAAVPLSMIPGSTEPGDRTVFFESASRLVPEDENDVYDVYQWQAGKLSLLSTGAAGAQHALYRGNDRSGRNVYISTRDRLTWEDVDSVLDVYVARSGPDAGFPEPLEPPACEVLADACQGAPAAAPAASGASTAVLSGSGNVVAKPKKPKRCARGKVRNKGKKCVDKKERRAQRTANHNRKAGR